VAEKTLVGAEGIREPEKGRPLNVETFPRHVTGANVYWGEPMGKSGSGGGAGGTYSSGNATLSAGTRVKFAMKIPVIPVVGKGRFFSGFTQGGFHGLGNTSGHWKTK